MGAAEGARPRTIIDKLWDAHAVASREDGQTLLWIDRHYLHEGSFHAFDQLARRKAGVARPDLSFAIVDHYAPTRRRGEEDIAPEILRMIADLRANTLRHAIRLVDLRDPRQGIVHVAMPEQGLTLPGLTIVCGDSHSSTHGAFGAFAFGIGASEVAHVLMTQTLWQRRPKRMRVVVEGALPEGASAKDIALTLIATIGADGAREHAIEYAGSTIRALSMEGRMTLCNLSIEAGARLGIVAPDDTTFAWLEGRPFVPKGAAFARALVDWRALASDSEAAFDREVTLAADTIAPCVTWGVSPEQAAPIDALVPDPDGLADAARAEAMRDALGYMGLRPGQKLTDIAVDRVFIGSCTNGRIEDLRAAAAILAGRKAAVPGLVSPGSGAVKRQAEEERLDRIFREAGLEWVDSGCSMCVGMNGDIGAPGERCASTTNRNFKGRQGVGVRTHLMSPAMAAAAALMGRLTDARALMRPGGGAAAAPLTIGAGGP